PLRILEALPRDHLFENPVPQPRPLPRPPTLPWTSSTVRSQPSSAKNTSRRSPPRTRKRSVRSRLLDRHAEQQRQLHQQQAITLEALVPVSWSPTSPSLWTALRCRRAPPQRLPAA
ncbi:unnamed protein product, partial [Ectocarpus sp. 6 AP-2014]